MGLMDWIRRRRRSVEAGSDTDRAVETESGQSIDANAEDFEAAFRLHINHDLDGAGRIYRKLLRDNPEDIRALHLLGTLHGQKGEAAEAVKHLERAADLSPGQANILADLARVRVMEDKLDAAEVLLRKAVDIDPGEARYHFALGQLLIQRGDTADAIGLLDRAVQLNPEFVEAYCDLGAAYLETGRLTPAREALEAALRLDNGLVAARLNLAHLYSLIEDFDQAESQYRAVIELDPAHEQAQERLGKLYLIAGEEEKALHCYKRLAARFPEKTATWKHLGEIAEKLGLLPQAADWYEESLKLDARQPDVLVNLGAVYGRAGRYEQAATCLESALALRENLDAAYHNLGATYYMQGRQDEALGAYEKALELAPYSHETLSNLIGISHYRRRKDTCYMADLFNRYLESLAPERIKATIPADHDRAPRRRLKIGYVSPDFRQHSVCYFIQPAIEGHDRENFEVYCYSDVPNPDQKTAFLKSVADHWRDIRGENDDSVSELIRRDRIDILVDLNGHFANNRLPVFAQKPVPVQIAYLGYPATTGLPEIDYRLTDGVTDPPGDVECEYTETLVRLPEVFLCYEPPSAVPPVSTARGVRRSVCFGSFNELPKVSPEVVRAWSSILARVPGSTLILKARAFSDEGTRDRVMRRFQDAGVEASRVELLARTPGLEAHLALYARVDVALDTFPYNGTTTTCEALYMGVPVITLAGDAHVSRVGASLLKTLGLDSLIARSEDGYVESAVALAGDLPARTRLRGTLRGRMLESSLTDKRAFVSNLESIYRRLWKTWCETELPSAANTTTSDHEPVPDVAGAIGIQTVYSDTVWVPDDPNRLTTYVLCEQETWFEDEIEFVRAYLDDGMRVLDIGANYGLYTLLAAKRVGRNGRVWSFEPASRTHRWLSANVRYNACDCTRLVNAALSDFNGVVKLRVFEDSEYNRLAAGEAQEVPGELVGVRRLDSWAAAEGISAVDFVKLDAEGAEKRILDGGGRFFAGESPLVMFEIRSGGEADWSLVGKFRALGYAVYRLAPGPGVLVPVGDAGEVDDYTLNLFACDPQRQDLLSKRGLLLSHTPAAAWVSCSSRQAVWDYLEERAFSREFVEAWRSGVKALEPGAGERLFRVLGSYLAAHEEAVPAGDAFTCLLDAYRGCAPAGTGALAPALQILKARIAAELGRRAEAVRILQTMLDPANVNGNWCTRLPFLPPSPHFDGIAPGRRPGAWLDASVLDAYLRMAAYSSYFMGPDQLALLERLHESGFERPEMERRRLLLSARLGRKSEPPSDRLLQASNANLNPAFWRRFRPEMLSG